MLSTRFRVLLIAIGLAVVALGASAPVAQAAESNPEGCSLYVRCRYGTGGEEGGMICKTTLCTYIPGSGQVCNTCECEISCSAPGGPTH